MRERERESAVWSWSGPWTIIVPISTISEPCYNRTLTIPQSHYNYVKTISQLDAVTTLYLYKKEKGNSKQKPTPCRRNINVNTRYVPFISVAENIYFFQIRNFNRYSVYVVDKLICIKVGVCLTLVTENSSGWQ